MINVYMNGIQAKQAGTIYTTSNVKVMTLMQFKIEVYDYPGVDVDITLEDINYNNEITLTNNKGLNGNPVICNFTLEPARAQMQYFMRFRIKSSEKSSYIFIRFNCLMSATVGVNAGTVASNMKFNNQGKWDGAKQLAATFQWNTSSMKKNWTTIGTAAGNFITSPSSLFKTIGQVYNKITHKRRIKNGLKTIWIDCTFDEDTVDELSITDHPVDATNTISRSVTDYAYRLPTTYTINAGIDSGTLVGGTMIGQAINTIKIIGNAVSNLFKGNIGGASLLEQQYQVLLDIQRDRQLVTIVTKKRTYNNMLLKRLRVKTDIDTEQVLNFTAEFREVIIVGTNVVASLIKSASSLAGVSSPIEAGASPTTRFIETPTLKTSILNDVNSLRR